ncbi:hypothetical protein LCGC14_0397120 [marine sediment metagenome]|uniref:Uncharacterized protein n=1 Tax=marine sediment metagenome TaxID=412755 RepID=A0A0F9T3J9_9ZZZZ
MSEQAWAEAWVKAWAEMPDIGQGHTVDVRKEGKKVFSYTYASLHDILKAVQPVLTEHGFAVSQSPTPDGIETHITHRDGFTKVFGPVPMPYSTDPKAIGSGITYGRRYGLTAALGIATDEDNDAPEASGAPEEPRSEASRAASRAPRTGDAHDELWTYVTERFPVPDRQTVFFDALQDAGVEDKKRANKTQATKARKYLEGLKA